MTHKCILNCTFSLSIITTALACAGCQSTKSSNSSVLYEADQDTMEVKTETTAKRGQESILDATVREFRLRKQATIQEFDSGYDRAVEAMEKTRFEYAMGTILHARVILNEGKQFLNTAELESRDKMASELIENIKKAQELYSKLGPYQ